MTKVSRFADDRFALLAEHKASYWAEQYRERGAAATLQASGQLLEHMQFVQPGYPSPEERRADLAHHIRMRKLFNRAARALVFHALHQRSG